MNLLRVFQTVIPILLYFYSLTCFAQNDSLTRNTDSLIKQIQYLINNNQSDSLYSLMGDKFKGKVSTQQMKQVIAQMSQQLGKWETYEKKDTKEGVVTYKSKFERAHVDLLISQDNKGKIETFLFKPSQ